ncbi:glutamine--fructose-6-phosphate transaminase (isomerizing) [Porticoccaceae bacterium]|jgi:glucosamine--fructose-6-phosphate aminotransferase (isomerizing)|nr:glutamine--fructose-6-phosphate transaminase (isomerizing) [Porticoccaceae bacterium]MDB9843917.1 glutamine--fructose-6-phosphate transaminase (isomerizing) [Porticoccaceae bacterium]MDC1477382.1 glutamine--fructose-6-phosphate transaminase (isomerizing) [Porticoccaceae bacterium]CAI8264583.1 MAG: Glutamine--fructose-6-phosphate aminotransferase [isomerizing] [SAR92 bacterium MED-G29]|tara:strand:+ start:2582 stop:4417 length:1836 start_codon:yes stop_codon:yes gene_type:complete
MCGIVGAATQRNVYKILIEGLHRLEYRGYDSAGLSIIDENNILQTRKNIGKVAELEAVAAQNPVAGNTGIAHTRWATHGEPSTTNSHPHTSGKVSVVHNGIIENHDSLRTELIAAGYEFISATDTEVVAHLVNYYLKQDDDTNLRNAVQKTIGRLAGAYALGVISQDQPDTIIAARSGSPLVIGVGIDEHFIASDQMALRQVTDRFVFLDEGDLVDLTSDRYQVFDESGNSVERPMTTLDEKDQIAEKGEYRHFMQKEIFEQAKVLGDTFAGRIGKDSIHEAIFGYKAEDLFAKTKAIHIIACGTSFHSGLVAKYWLEHYAGIPCQVEVASEYRYRNVAVPQGTLFISISQSGETADTLAALHKAKQNGYLGFLAICNVANSSLVRESDIALMTLAGPEIGVASTKAFTTQLVALQLLSISLAKHNGLDAATEKELVQNLHKLPELCTQVLALDTVIEEVSEAFANKHHALFLGRGEQYPIALEGALKLKEISYIHAEAYPSGELKHGPLALVDEDMPVVTVAPNNELLEKLKSNLHEVRARGGQLFVFADRDSGFVSEPGITVIDMPHVPQSLEAIIYTLPLQMLSYHVAVLKGTDVDQPRNLAKSVTVE